MSEVLLWWMSDVLCLDLDQKLPKNRLKFALKNDNFKANFRDLRWEIFEFSFLKYKMMNFLIESSTETFLFNWSDVDTFYFNFWLYLYIDYCTWLYARWLRTNHHTTTPHHTTSLCVIYRLENFKDHRPMRWDHWGKGMRQHMFLPSPKILNSKSAIHFLERA